MCERYGSRKYQNSDTFLPRTEIREYVSEEQVFENERPKMQVTVFKRSENTQKGLAGARFGLYAGENILSDGNRIAAKRYAACSGVQ